MRDRKMFENKDWGEKFKNWRNSFIPKHISGKTLLFAYSVLAVICPINNKIRASHKDRNEMVWEENSSKYTIDGYIEHQYKMEEIIYGTEKKRLTKALKMGAYNGTTSTCEVIATYNALQHLSDNSHDSFADLLFYYEGNGCALYGYFGTSPDAIKTYFIERDFDTVQLTGNKARNADAVNELGQAYDTYIVTVYNDKEDINKQIHTMCITKDGSKYTIHNDYSGHNKDYTEYDVDSTTLNDVIADYNGGKSKTISLLGVKNK